jgi:hypothetical protein
VGQHSVCDAEYVKKYTVPAKESEYADLNEELESIGYTLKISKL